MTKTTTITINGRLYDAVTGKELVRATTQPKQALPSQGNMRAFSDIGPSPAAANKPLQKVAVHHPATKPAVARANHPAAQAIHQRPQKSATLYRKALKKPVAELPSASIDSTQLPGRSPLISKFGPNITIHPSLARKAEQAADEPPTPPQIHPTVTKAVQRQAATPQQLSGKELKEQLIKERLAEVSVTKPKKEKKPGLFARKPRLAAILSTTLGLLLLGGYLTYMNLPMISMQVAANRAGVSATFPTYKPDGYGLNGPITYAPGEVTINYKSTTNDNNFKVTQKPSNWDSQGLLDNYVTRNTENYLTFQESGVTVYTFGNHAAWVNGGIVYTLDGNASLSSDQVLRLAKSM